jgi:hypothetical protein
MVNRKLTYSLVMSGVFCLYGLLLSAQHSDLSGIVPEKREALIQSAILKLQSFPSDTTIREVEIQELSSENYFRLKIRIKETGVLKLPGKDRIYFISSSSHGNPETGDFTLAMDSIGKIYSNNGHVCGGIIHFETGEIKKLKTSEQFFRYFVSDTDGEKWKKIR